MRSKSSLTHGTSSIPSCGNRVNVTSLAPDGVLGSGQAFMSYDDWMSCVDRIDASTSTWGVIAGIAEVQA